MDYILEKKDGSSIGDKKSSRELFLSACEEIIGQGVERRGPTEQHISELFNYEIGFIGDKYSTTSINFSFKGNWDYPENQVVTEINLFMKKLSEVTELKAINMFDGQEVK